MSAAIHEQFRDIAGEISGSLHEAISSVGPLKLKRRRDVALPVLLCRIVAGQQLSTHAARTIWGRVEASAGDAELLEHVESCDIEQLRACGLSRAKARAMKSIVDSERAGDLNTRKLGRLNHAERSQSLTEIWGVGQWTADMVGISYFGDADIWPESDVTVWKTLEKLTDKRRKTSRTALRFAPHRTYLAMYMWRIADAVPEG